MKQRKRDQRGEARVLFWTSGRQTIVYWDALSTLYLKSYPSCPTGLLQRHQKAFEKKVS